MAAAKSAAKSIVRTVSTSFLLVALFASTADAQSSVRAKYLTGQWRMVIDVDEDAESPIERIGLKLAHGVLDEVDIRFEFLPDNVLRITTNVFGEAEVEYSEWRINDRNELVLGDSKRISAENTVWMFHEGRLAAYKYRDGVRKQSERLYLEVIRD